jgi:4-hydroxythreonine-4-phosphate dehydrogenase
MRTIAITLGDVAGIGPEVVRKALRSGRLNRKFCYEIVLEPYVPKVKLGKISRAAAQFALASLEEGVAGCLRGDHAALVTGPVNKAGLHSIGFKFPGQTEWLANQTQTKKFAMMLVGGKLRVVLATIHIPIKSVSASLTKTGIFEKIQLTHEWLKKSGIPNPRILVAALNPHGGVLSEQGREEKKIIAPAVEAACKKFGESVSGPYSPDYVFWLANQDKADAVICMYHDQGLIPLKMLAFDRGVNLTLGLPIVRASPDHGTAYDIAGKNKASSESMIEAINLAAGLCEKQETSIPIKKNRAN